MCGCGLAFSANTNRLPTSVSSDFISASGLLPWALLKSIAEGPQFCLQVRSGAVSGHRHAWRQLRSGLKDWKVWFGGDCEGLECAEKGARMEPMGQRDEGSGWCSFEKGAETLCWWLWLWLLFLFLFLFLFFLLFYNPKNSGPKSHRVLRCFEGPDPCYGGPDPYHGGQGFLRKHKKTRTQISLLSLSMPL